jgi:beta-lactamase regulating signal transducer with metallopeptidase domain
MIAPGFAAVAQSTVLALALSSGLGFIIAPFSYAVIRLTRSVNPVTRFAVWFLALLSIMALPLARLLLRRTLGEVIPVDHSCLTVSDSWCWVIFYGWLAVASFGLLRIGAALVKLNLLRKRCETLDPATLSPELQEALTHSSRHTKVLVSHEIRVPTAMGFLHPAVVLPTWAADELPSADLHNVILHELAHLDRWDDWTNLTQKILRAILFFHPAVWWIDRHLSLEREMACDDRVVERTANARSYARCLIALAERVSDKSLPGRALALAQGAVSRLQDTSLRIMRLLSLPQAPQTRTSKPLVGLLALFAVLCGVGVQRLPDIVAFQNEAAGTQPQFAYAGSRTIPAAVIPAALKMSDGHALRKNLSERTKRVERTRRLRQLSRVARNSEAAPVLASYSGQPTVMQAVFVITRTGYEGAELGPAVWSITVWRVEVTVDEKTVSQQEIPTKTT